MVLTVASVACVVVAFHVGLYASTWPSNEGVEVEAAAFFWAFLGCCGALAGGLWSADG